MRASETARPRREVGALLTIALPLAAAYLAEIAMMLTDIVIVGRLGSLELAAVGLAGDLVVETLLFATAIFSIVGVLVAHAGGAGDHGSIGHTVRQGLWLALALSIPGTALSWNLAPLLALTGQDPGVVELAGDYLHAVAWCFLPSLWFVVLRELMAALSQPRSVMAISIAAVGVNAVATYGLVFGAFGLPALGVAGAGWATTLVCWGMFGALAIHVARGRRTRTYRLFGDLERPDPATCWRILRLGTPIGGLALVEAGMFAVVAILMGVLGTTQLAANQVLFSAATVGLVVAIAIGEAAAIRVAHGTGSGAPAAARRAGFLGMGMGIVVMAAVAIAFVAMPRTITGFFLDTADPANADVVAYAATLFVIAALFQVSDGIQAIASRALRGLKDTMTPMWIAAVGYWVFGVGGGCLLAFPLGFGGVGLWWGLAMGLTITSILLTWRYHILSRRRIGGLGVGTMGVNTP